MSDDHSQKNKGYKPSHLSSTSIAAPTSCGHSISGSFGGITLSTAPLSEATSNKTSNANPPSTPTGPRPPSQ